MTASNNNINISISVRNLTEFCCRCGSIDSYGDSLRDPDILSEGQRAHKKFQKEQSDEYESEVSLKLISEIKLTKKISFQNSTLESVTYTIEGRADGIHKDSSTSVYTVDEIKSTYKNVDSFVSPSPTHLAQAKCYAYIYACQHDLKKISVRMVYIQLGSKKIKYFGEIYTKKEITDWFNSLILSYHTFCLLQLEHIQKRDIFLKDLNFPFDYREGQKKLMGDIYISILRRKRLYLEAATGSGKTIANIFPGIKALSEGKISRIFYITAKNITRTVALDTVKLLCDSASPLRTLILTAREKICLLKQDKISDEVNCNQDSCPYARGHFDRVNTALQEILSHENIISNDVLLFYARKYEVCPYSLSRDIAYFCDIIICDYNYVFAPDVYLSGFFGADRQNSPDIYDDIYRYLHHGSKSDDETDETKENENSTYLILTDEAHNLVSRARSMYSASLSYTYLFEIKEFFTSLSDSLIVNNNIKKGYKNVHRLLNHCRANIKTIYNTLTAIREESSFNFHNTYRLTAEDEEFLFSTVSMLLNNLEKFLLQKKCRDFLKEKSDKSTFSDFYFLIRFLNDIYENENDNYINYISISEDGDNILTLDCMEPKELIEEKLQKSRACIFFSATLRPVNYFKEQLAGRENDYCIYSPSPFDKKRRLTLVATDVSTLYSRRNSAEYEKLSDYLFTFMYSRPGNYMFFFPSYKFLGEIAEILSEKIRKTSSTIHPTLIIQSRQMSEEDKEAFLEEFKSNPKDSFKVGLCVLGGVFSEGIDLQGEALIGVAVLGTGLPMVCSENEIYKYYFDKAHKSGFDYAYTYPGMNKVTQAGGRLIRTAEDCGVILLLDERFTKNSYRQLFPGEWQPVVPVNRSTISDKLNEFWTKL